MNTKKRKELSAEVRKARLDNSLALSLKYNGKLKRNRLHRLKLHIRHKARPKQAKLSSGELMVNYARKLKAIFNITIPV